MASTFTVMFSVRTLAVPNGCATNTFSSNKLSSFASISRSQFGRPHNVILPRLCSFKVNATKELHFEPNAHTKKSED